MDNKKTKILCTLGPASSSPDTIKNMFLAGMNAGRFNFSHGTHESHRDMISMFRSVRYELGIPAAVVLDTKGPEIRIGVFENGSVELSAGDNFTLTTEKCTGNTDRVFVNYPKLPGCVNPGDKILIDDGFIRLNVDSVSDTDIKCTAENSGTLGSKKGVNVPGVHLNQEYLSDADKSDLLFGIEMDVDYVAASFVRNADDVNDLRAFLRDNGGGNIKIISKIENTEGINDFDNILDASDGIMVARGDMGVEVDFERIPGIQKEFIHKCCKEGKLVITATQMLESMTENPSPTRAEITDVANAIFDGTSAVMLSGESAAGKYPVEAVNTMSKIILQAEKDDMKTANGHIDYYVDHSDISNAIGHAACTTASDINAAAVIAVTTSGYTAEMMSKYRPQVPVIASTPNAKTYHQQSLVRGVYPVMSQLSSDWSVLMKESIKTSEMMGFVHKGDTVVISAGMPLQTPGTTNLIRVERV